MPGDAVVALADDEVAEERLVARELLADAHHHRAVHVALARAEVAVVREVAHRGADRDAVELVEDHLGPAAHGERVHHELLLRLDDRAVEADGLLELVAPRAVARVARRVLQHLLLRLLELLGREVLRDGEHLVLGDDLHLGAEQAAEQHLRAAARVEAGHAPADEADAHLVERLHRARHVDGRRQLCGRVRRAGLGVDVEVRDVQAVHVVRVHVRRAERVVLEAAAVRVGLLHRPQDHRDVAEALREHRRHHAERERHEVRDEHVGTVLLPLAQ